MLTPPARPAARLGVLGVLIGFVIGHLPALGIGLTADDLWWALSLNGGTNAAPFDLNYTVAEDFWRDRGVGFRWTSPDLRWTLARPLAGALLEVLIPVFDPRSWAWQGLGLVGTLGLLTASWPLYQRLLGGRAAVLALALFAAHPAHLQLVWFVSNHHAWMGATPALLGLVAWTRWRLEGWAPGLWLAPMGVILGLASSETALGALPYAAALEWVTRRPGWRRAIAAGKQASKSAVTEKVTDTTWSPMSWLRSTSACTRSATAAPIASTVLASAVVAPRRARSTTFSFMADTAKGVGRSRPTRG
jgi:hypothetical protein